MDRLTPPAKREALLAYASMLNRTDPSVLAPLLAEVFRLTSRRASSKRCARPARSPHCICAASPAPLG